MNKPEPPNEEPVMSETQDRMTHADWLRAIAALAPDHKDRLLDSADEIERLERELQACTDERDEARARADTKYQTVAKAVFDTVQDAAATWDTACEELIWGDYDPDGPDHQPVSEDHLAACCVRFPQWAEDMRDFTTRWNVDDGLTDEELAAIEIPREELERNERSLQRIMNFYRLLKKVETRAEASESLVASLERALGEERERCAKVCDERAAELEKELSECGIRSDMRHRLHARISVAQALAAAIRSQPSPTPERSFDR